MPKAAKRKPEFTFQRTLEVDVYLPEFEALESLKSLDYGRLQKGMHKIEIGFLSGGCCRRLVNANIRNGMVTGFEVESCAESKSASGEVMAILKEARRRMLEKNGTWEPIPVAELARISGIDIFINGNCLIICAEPYFCFACCADGAGARCIDLDEIIR
jgi:hypothetical protein